MSRMCRAGVRNGGLRSVVTGIGNGCGRAQPSENRYVQNDVGCLFQLVSVNIDELYNNLK